MLKYFMSVLVILIACIPSFGQPTSLPNLIPNPGFETFFNLPSSEGDLFEAVAWENLNGGTAWPYATPDFFHTSGTGDAQLPNSFAGTITPQSGSGIAGFITYNVFAPDYREYISAPLVDTMQVGQAYTLSFWLSNAHSNPYARLGTDNVGVCFTVGAPTQVVNSLMAVDAQIEIPNITYHNSWVQYSFVFTPSQRFTHITIGNFNDDANTSKAVFASGYSMAYYFLDELFLSQASPLPIEGLSLSANGLQDGIKLDWGHPSDSEEGEWVLERSRDQNSFQNLISFTKDKFLKDYTDETAYPNLDYYYRLRHTTEEGLVEYSNLVQSSFDAPEAYVAGSIFPNPVKDQFSMEFANGEAAQLTLSIVNVQGQEVHRSFQDIEAGEHLLGFNLEQDLAAGYYFAKFSFQGQQFVKKIYAAAE